MEIDGENGIGNERISLQENVTEHRTSIEAELG
jgi:hypothetical protein